MSSNTILNVFIASPGDVVIERKIVREVCLGLNESELLHHLGVSIRASMWEEIFPSAQDPQAIIKRVAEECDIMVLIFCGRFYTRAERGESENLNRFLMAYDSWKTMKKPHVIFYFKRITDPAKDTYPDGIIEVNDMKEKIQKEKALFADEFSAPYEFCEKIYDHIEKWVAVKANMH